MSPSKQSRGVTDFKKLGPGWRASSGAPRQLLNGSSALAAWQEVAQFSTTLKEKSQTLFAILSMRQWQIGGTKLGLVLMNIGTVTPRPVKIFNLTQYIARFP